MSAQIDGFSASGNLDPSVAQCLDIAIIRHNVAALQAIAGQRMEWSATGIQAIHRMDGEYVDEA